ALSLAALAVATVQAGHAAIHDDHGLGAALFAEGGTGGEGRGLVATWGGGLLPGFELGPLLRQDALLDIAHFLALHPTDGLHVLLNHGAHFGHQRRHENAAFFVVATVRCIDRTQLFHQKGNVTTFAEYGRNNPSQRENPLEVLHRLGVDEDLVGATDLVVGAFVQDDVVDRDVERVVRDRRLDLVRRAQQKIRAFDGFVHFDRLGLVDNGSRYFCDVRLLDCVADDFLIDFDRHVLNPGISYVRLDR